MKNLPALLRRCNHRVKVVLFRDSDSRKFSSWHVVSIQDCTATSPICGIALDIGTTRLAARLIDLENFKTLDETGFDNPQTAIAPDVLARIHHAKDAKGLEELRGLNH